MVQTNNMQLNLYIYNQIAVYREGEFAYWSLKFDFDKYLFLIGDFLLFGFVFMSKIPIDISLKEKSIYEKK